MKNSWKADLALVLIIVYIFCCLVLPATSHARVQIRKETVFGEPGDLPNTSINDDGLSSNSETESIYNRNSTYSLDDTRYSWWLLSLRFTLNQIVGFIL